MKIKERVIGDSVAQEKAVWQEDIWQGIGLLVKAGLKTFLENLLKEEIAQSIGANKYQRRESRKGYRNGKYERSLLTRYGMIDDLNVPRVRDGNIEFRLFEKYQRRQYEVDAAIGRLFLLGVSTRKLKKYACEFLGAEISATTVSKTTETIEKEMEMFQRAEISDEVEFLFLDGMVHKVREIGVEKKSILAALVIYKDGRKELVGFQIAESETVNAWRGFLVSLKSRGLTGKNLKLITVDGNPALLTALDEIYPFAKVQRCIAHKMRNVVTKLKKSQRASCGVQAKLIFAAPSRTEAIRRFKEWKGKWQIEAERATRCMEKNLNDCLKFYDFPESIWKTIRTTNILERSIREVRRRTKPMGGVFTNERSCNRIIYGVTQYLNENWAEKNRNTQNEFTQNS